MSEPDLYGLLGVSPNASDTEIKKVRCLSNFFPKSCLA